MSDKTIDDDNLDLGSGGDDDAKQTPKALRDHAKKLADENAELRKQFADLAEKQKARDLAELLESKGASKRLAKYASKEIEDVSEDAVNEWLKENGEDFGWTPDEGDGQVDETEQQARRVRRATEEAPAARPTTDAELLHLLRTGDHKTLIEKGLIAPG